MYYIIEPYKMINNEKVILKGLEFQDKEDAKAYTSKLESKGIKYTTFIFDNDDYLLERLENKMGDDEKMNLSYKGINKNNGFRHSVIGNIKDEEIEIVENHLYNNNIEFDSFDDISGSIIYIEVEDKEEHEDFKNTIYKEINDKLKKLNNYFKLLLKVEDESELEKITNKIEELKK